MSAAIASPPKPTTTKAGRKLTALANRYRQGETEVLAELFEQAERLLWHLASRYRLSNNTYRGRVDADDLVSAGRVGLLEALRRFDGRGAFSTYAAHWARKEMQEAITTNISALSMSRGIYSRMLAAQRGYGQAPLPPDQLAAAETATRPAASLKEGCYLPAESDVITAGLDRHVKAEYLESALATLPARQALAIRLYYGLGGQRPQTHREIGKALGVTGSRSQQLVQEGLQRLREVLAPEEGVNS